MFSGHLNPHTTRLLASTLLCTHGAQLYVFSRATQQCIKVIDMSLQANIVALYVEEAEAGCKVAVLDGTGALLRGDLDREGDWKIVGRAKLGRNVSKAAFVSKNVVVLIDAKHKLHIYDVENEALRPLHSELAFSQIIYTQGDPNFHATLQGQLLVKTLTCEDLRQLKQYSHKCRILSATTVGTTLVVGDEQGKITLLYNHLAEKAPKSSHKQLQSVLEWHTGPVLALCSNGQYIYSAGEENVVVLWHVRDLSRDFLPRVRTAIGSLYVKSETNEIVCQLLDSTVKVIDLSKDKETQTYKTVIDPEGYAATGRGHFTPETTSCINGRLCLNALPGKLQFINLSRNGENTELQIVPRNLINSINNQKLDPHRINAFAFSSDSTALTACLRISDKKSYIKFYRQAAEGYLLTSKIENPHCSAIQGCLAVGSKGQRFLTYSLGDPIIRVWFEFRQKKKSIIDADQTFWKCHQQLKFRNLVPTHASAYKNLLSIVYHHSQVVVYNCEQNSAVEVQFATAGDVEQVHVLNSTSGKKGNSMNLLVIRNKLDLQIWECAYAQGEATGLKNVHKIHIEGKQAKYFVKQNEQKLAFVMSRQGKSEIVLLDKKQLKFNQGYKCDTQVQSAFWHDSRLILIGSGVSLFSLDGKQFINFSQSSQSDFAMIEDESTDVKIHNDMDIFRINQRWVERQSLRTKKKVQDSLEGLQLLPNCSYAWQQLSSKIII